MANKKTNYMFIIGMVLVIGYFLYTLGPLFLNLQRDEIKVTDDNNQLIKQSECMYPKEVVGIRCCISDSELRIMCKDESDLYLLKINESLENERYSHENLISDDKYKIKFLSPTDYLIVNNIKMGGIDLPYDYITSDGYSNWAEIRILDLKGYDQSGKTTNISELDIEEINAGVEKGKSEMELKGILSVSNSTWRLTRTSNGYKTYTQEFISEQNNEKVYSKLVLFLDNLIEVAYISTYDVSYLVADADKLVNSLVIT